MQSVGSEEWDQEIKEAIIRTTTNGLQLRKEVAVQVAERVISSANAPLITSDSDDKMGLVLQQLTSKLRSVLRIEYLGQLLMSINQSEEVHHQAVAVPTSPPKHLSYRQQKSHISLTV